MDMIQSNNLERVGRFRLSNTVVHTSRGRSTTCPKNNHLLHGNYSYIVQCYRPQVQKQITSVTQLNMRQSWLSGCGAALARN